MADKLWKATERIVAKYFGTRRNPLSGQGSGVTASDSRHETLFIETKLFTTKGPYAATVRLYEEAKALAKKEGKIPILCIRKKQMKGFLIVVHSDDVSPLEEAVFDAKFV